MDVLDIAFGYFTANPEIDAAIALIIIVILRVRKRG